VQEFLQPHFKNKEIDSIFVQKVVAKVVAIYNHDKKIKIGNERVSKRTEIPTSLFFTFHRK
jgi:hypothetical protein